MEAIPAKQFKFALYLQHLASASRSRVAVEEACNALTWVHSTAGLASPVSSPAAIVEDAHRLGALADLRLATACLLAFAGFLSFNELVALRSCYISI